MITEVAVLHIKKDQSVLFENAFEKAQQIISTVKGYKQHELLKGVEESNTYLLIVRWEKLEDHTEGFRKSDEYNEWKKLLHHFYDPFPVVYHYKNSF